jgi:hypothetical protein
MSRVLGINDGRHVLVDDQAGTPPPYTAHDASQVPGGPALSHDPEQTTPDTGLVNTLQTEEVSIGLEMKNPAVSETTPLSASDPILLETKLPPGTDQGASPEEVLTKRYAMLYRKVSARVYQQYCATTPKAAQVSISEWTSVFQAVVMFALDDRYAAKLRSFTANQVARETNKSIAHLREYPSRLMDLLESQWAHFEPCMKSLRSAEDYEIGVSVDPLMIRVHPMFSRNETKTFLDLAQVGQIEEAETALSLMPAEMHDWNAYHQRAQELADPKHVIASSKALRPPPFEIRRVDQHVLGAFFALINVEHRIYIECNKVLDTLRRISPVQSNKELKHTATQVMVDSRVFPTQAMGKIIEDVERARFVIIAAICKPAIDQQYASIVAKDVASAGISEDARQKCVQAGIELACRAT